VNQGEVDVCVIGSGAGGAVVAQRLGAAGLSVAVVEAGPRFDPRRAFHSHRPDREAFPQLLAGPRQYTWGPCERLQRSYSDLRSWSKARGLHNSTRRRTPPRVFRVKGVGGSTLHYEGEAHRLAPEGFRLRSLTGVGADWPISYEDLAPYYRETEAVLQAARSSVGRARSWDSPCSPTPWPSSRKPTTVALRATTAMVASGVA
jgi:choline dehydrogenase-like flavoprotein